MRQPDVSYSAVIGDKFCKLLSGKGGISTLIKCQGHGLCGYYRRDVIDHCDIGQGGGGIAGGIRDGEDNLVVTDIAAVKVCPVKA
ncbi:hypothetical protein D9M69_692890 [compost metagenome]